MHMFIPGGNKELIVVPTCLYKLPVCTRLGGFCGATAAFISPTAPTNTPLSPHVSPVLSASPISPLQRALIVPRFTVAARYVRLNREIEVFLVLLAQHMDSSAGLPGGRRRGWSYTQISFNEKPASQPTVPDSCGGRARRYWLPSTQNPPFLLCCTACKQGGHIQMS